MYAVVLDTNVIIAALRSRRGASFAVLHRIGIEWEPLISVPLILEYEAVGKREAQKLKIPVGTVDAIIRAFCFTGRKIDIYFADNERRGNMSKNITVPEDLYNKAAELAAKDHVSVEELVSGLLQNQFADREYIETRVQLFSREEFERASKAIPDVEPEPYDRQ
jgi:predicted nucleic acid-binding protein